MDTEQGTPVATTEAAPPTSRSGRRTPLRPRNDFSTFIRIFNDIAGHRHRYEVFRDFVTMGAICLHNSVIPSKSLEDEYLAVIDRYDKKAQTAFPVLLAELIVLLDPEPRDILGQLFMQFELGNDRTGQFFTPPEISELIAQMTFGEAVASATEEFVTICEPACGAGGMVLAFAKVVIAAKKNPAKAMWAQCQDVDRVAALMCYLQLSLWNIPAVVIVGNTLAMEAREVFYTPAHRLGFWGVKLRRRERERAAKGLVCDTQVPSSALDPASNDTRDDAMPVEFSETLFATSEHQDRPVASGQQIGFDFGL